MNDSIRDQRVLVTGGAGFIGSRIAESLVPSNDVVVIDDLSSGVRSRVPEEAVFIDEDIAQLETVTLGSNFDVIFHQAALVDVVRSIETPLESHSRTAYGTLKVLEFARETDTRVVMASSAAVYGEQEKIPIDESAPKKPRSPYAIDKLVADHYGRVFNDLYGVETIVLRYFNVYGPGQQVGPYNGVITTFMDKAREGEPLQIHGDGQQTRDFVFIDDVVEANLRACVTDSVGTAFNVGTGSRSTIQHLAETIISITDSQSDVRFTQKRDGDIRHSEANINRIREKLGYNPMYSLREGLESMYSSS